MILFLILLLFITLLLITIGILVIKLVTKIGGEIYFPPKPIIKPKRKYATKRISKPARKI